MNTVSLVDFRKNAKGILRRVGRGQSLLLTSRGRPVARLEPVASGEARSEDPIYRLADFAAEGGESLSNEEMDGTIYGR